MDSPRINTYNIVTSYKEYKSKLTSPSSGDGVMIVSACQSFKYENVKLYNGSFPEICSTAIQFLGHLKENLNNYRDDGCKYLFYSLYVDVLNRNTSIENTLILLKKLNNIFNEDYDGDNELDNYINKMDKNICDKLVKLIDIYDVFNKFESEFSSMPSIKTCTSECVELFKGYLEECRKGNDYDFCYELKNFREQYNAFVEKVILCEGKQHLLPPVEMFDTGNVIIIPSVIIVVAAFISPILYKFTAFGPWIRRTIGIRNNIFENINEETNNPIYTSEMVNKNSEKLNYNIVYSSS
ncbi:Plasmodium vivax Vir protein, putative [Plasmodium ovale]|uniref:Plasmodium vivax Vir protein, putative n=1 Tax=Plasmodium ovale TaxID=36330 RepID=A0A1C3KKY6_PLAOA|nr:Plasmodium vivax Vir protein, putative [Plasmodium ovale]